MLLEFWAKALSVCLHSKWRGDGFSPKNSCQKPQVSSMATQKKWREHIEQIVLTLYRIWASGCNCILFIMRILSHSNLRKKNWWRKRKENKKEKIEYIMKKWKCWSFSAFSVIAQVLQNSFVQAASSHLPLFRLSHHLHLLWPSFFYWLSVKRSFALFLNYCSAATPLQQRCSSSFQMLKHLQTLNTCFGAASPVCCCSAAAAHLRRCKLKDREKILAAAENPIASH